MVNPKKSLGQHFLFDHNIAGKIVNALPSSPSSVLEIGPGTGILSGRILENSGWDPRFIETDAESVEYLKVHFPGIEDRLIHADFLKTELKEIISEPYQIIGNLPYNISSQIFFRMLDDRDRLSSAVVMIQKEVADRIRSGPGNKTYGILSVLLQTWYDIEYLFTVSEHVFRPPPKVKSAVIRLVRNNTMDIDCPSAHYFAVVKAAFNQRRKTLRNALRSYLNEQNSREAAPYLSKRAEELGVGEFLQLAKMLE